jgi:hypothetical protein
MKLVHTAFDGPNAQLIKQLLDDNGIAAVVEGERLYALRGDMPTVYPTVWVANDADLPRACEIIEEFTKQSRAVAVRRETWTCKTCGEEIENQFSACWRCTEQMDAPPDRDPNRQKWKTALAVSLFMGVSCAFVSFFISHLAETSIQSPQTHRNLMQAAALTRLICILFGIIAAYFVARLAGSGKPAATKSDSGL